MTNIPPGGLPPDIYGRIKFRVTGPAMSTIAEIMTLDVLDIIRNVGNAHVLSAKTPEIEQALMALIRDIEARSGLKP